MAMTMDTVKSAGEVKIICRRDSALDVTDEEYDAYIDAGGDEAKLKFKPDSEPTRFLLDLNLRGKDAARIKNAMIGGRDDDGKPKMTMGDWQHAVVKRVLKGIENPASVPMEKQIRFTKDSQGQASDELMGWCERVGLVNNIFALYSSLVLSDGVRDNAKN